MQRGIVAFIVAGLVAALPVAISAEEKPPLPGKAAAQQAEQKGQQNVDQRSDHKAQHAPAAGADEKAEQEAELKALFAEAIRNFVSTRQGGSTRDPCPRNGREVTLRFRADGVIACEVNAISEHDLVKLEVKVPKSIAVSTSAGTPAQVDPVKSYSAVITPGERRSNLDIVRGDLSAAVKAGAAAAKLAAAAPPQLGEETSVVVPAQGPFNAKTITVSVRFDAAGVSHDTTVTVLRQYPFNLVLAGVGGEGIPKYSLKNGVIDERRPVGVDYYAALQWYPASWLHVGKRWTNGRHFDWNLDPNPAGWFSIMGGVSVTDPMQRLFAGVGVQPWTGLGLVAGYQFRRIEVLDEGHSAGQAFTGSALPTHKSWRGFWAVGLSLDTSLATTLADAFK